MTSYDFLKNDGSLGVYEDFGSGMFVVIGESYIISFKAGLLCAAIALVLAVVLILFGNSEGMQRGKRWIGKLILFLICSTAFLEIIAIIGKIGAGL